jgi:cytochrome d ubiquinol oxidase subunit I
VPSDIDPIAAMLNPASFPQALHMILAAYASTGFVVAGIHAFLLLRGRGTQFNIKALSIALLVGVPTALLQPISGDIAARHLATHQPAKFAAMEAHFTTERGAPLKIGGWPDVDARVTRFAIEIPKGLSLLGFHDRNAEVQGLDRVPRDDWPSVPAVHLAFQVMIALGTYMAIVGLWVGWRALRRRPVTDSRYLLRAIVVAGPMGFIATEAGWIVTELGRQPWIVYGIVRTSEAVTPMPGLIIPFLAFTLLYVLLGIVVAVLLHSQIVQSRIR